MHIMKKIAFFDIDGTLIDFGSKQISRKTVEALNRLKENGTLIVIATGRSPLALPSFRDIQFDAFLTFNGSYCYDSKEVLFSNPIEHEDILKLLNNASDINRPVCIATGNRLAANGKDDDLADYFKIAGLELEVANDFESLLNEDIYQIMMGGRKEEYPLILKDVHNAKIAAWWDRAIDIIPSNGGKGIAIKRVLEHYSIDPSEAIAFGDGNNDIEMLEAVGTGVAMLNASEELKKVASDICGHVSEDGIYHYCLEHHLIREDKGPNEGIENDDDIFGSFDSVEELMAALNS